MERVTPAQVKSILEGLAVIEARQRKILFQRFGVDQPCHTLAEIGDGEGTTRERARQLVEKAVRNIIKASK